MKKIIGYYRPCDLLTMASVVSALIGILLAFNNHFTLAIGMLVICGLCDAFDGNLARKNKYTLKQRIYGSELDSISDVIAFGIFPALLTIA